MFVCTVTSLRLLLAFPLGSCFCCSLHVSRFARQGTERHIRGDQFLPTTSMDFVGLYLQEHVEHDPPKPSLTSSATPCGVELDLVYGEETDSLLFTHRHFSPPPRLTEVQCPMEVALWDFVDSWQELCSVIIRNNVDNNSIPPTTRTYSGQTQL